jgi:uridine kinase
MRKPLVIAIAGGSGSGKTTLATVLADAIPRRVSVLRHDSYYHGAARLPASDGGEVNFDSREAIETPLFVKHLDQLIAGQAIVAPKYDFETHTRSATGYAVPAADVIIVEGVMVLLEPTIRARTDIGLYVDLAPDIRFLRRLKRDTTERGRTAESVMAQYVSTVRPFQQTHVEPSRQFADLVVNTQDFARFAKAIVKLTAK